MIDSQAVDGLNEPVEILVDGWGIPHIYAASASDAFFAQGFNAARDRLWQIDLWRRAGLGRLAEVLGPDFVERDRAARLFLYRGSMDSEWGAYGCDLRSIVTPFVAGINEYVRQTADDPDLLPPEFATLGYRPARWSPEDVLRIRAHGLHVNLHNEVTRARMLHAFGADVERVRALLEPETELVVPEGIDLSLITADVLRTYDLATGATPTPMPSPGRAAGGGSNNWAVGGGRTASGRPILASDPHRALRLPSLRYLVHVACPDFEFIGGTEPMLPGISVGHNGHIAFSFTFLPIDHEDLYVYEVDDAGQRYRYASGWEAFEVERQLIPVKGSAPAEVELKFTRHGPVVHERPDRNAAFAVRAAWLESGMAPYVGSSALLEAKSWDQFRDASRHWGTPGENLVYADVDGNVGWQPAGRVPIRPNWNGLLPVPGDGRFEWAGYLDPGAMPHELNPDRRWIATANQRNVDPDSTGGVPVAFEWEPPYRHQRIADVLEHESSATIESTVRLQNDYTSAVAQQVVPLVAALSSPDSRVRRAVTMLSTWDCKIEAGSAPAALFELWFRIHLRRALLRRTLADRLPATDVDRAVDAVMEDVTVIRDARIDLRLLHAVSPADALLEPSLRDAMLDLEQRLGPDSRDWSWGRVHRASFEHPLAAFGHDFAPLESHPRGGSVDTVGNTTYGPAGFLQTVGATLRMVLDVGDWDNSVAMNAPGQSGVPSTPHYADLLGAWAKDESIPLLYSRERVEAVATRRLRLLPVNRVVGHT